MAIAQVVQINFTMTEAARAIRHSLPAHGLRDDSLVIKTILAEALGGLVVKPWRVHSIRNGAVTVIGYSVTPDLAARLELAMPALRTAIELFASPIPELSAGQRLRFRTRFVPTVREDKREHDAFLAAVHKAGDRPVAREDVYRSYVSERLHGAAVQSLIFDDFSLREFVRPIHLPDSRKWATLTMPVAEVSGVLSVTEPDVLRKTLLGGIGRHNAYGFGYVRLEAEI